MPCVQGRPQEFEHQDTFAIATKAIFPGCLSPTALLPAFTHSNTLAYIGTRILQYRITDAVPYAGIVHDLMLAHPEYFVRWTHPPTANGRHSVLTHPMHTIF